MPADRDPAGTGPGAITRDGCAVELYALLPVGAEPELVAATALPGSTVLELGAGAGRVTHELVARSLQVTAVDESAEMLDHIKGAERVCAAIEGLQLDRRFDVVLLCSHLINTDDDAQREAFVSTAARHVAPGGCVIIERHDSRWFETASEGSVARGGITYSLDGLSRPGPGLLSATITYELADGRSWSQSFTAVDANDEMLTRLLEPHGLRIDRWLDDAGSWLRVIPMER